MNCTTCTSEATEMVTVLVDFDPTLGSVPGNGRLVNHEYCNRCAELVRFESVTAGADVEFVISVPLVEREAEEARATEADWYVWHNLTN